MRGSTLRRHIVCLNGAFMEIQEKKIKELIPYEKNPRKNDAAVEYVANSIKEFGFKVPIVIDKNGKENKAAIVEYTDVTGKTVKR